jgi:hypothetical protein
MAWKQTKGFNLNKGGRINGMCLQNVRLGYGIGSGAKNAISAWNATQQHRDKSFPGGVAVPLFYTYKSDGHINVLLPDGRIWNDGTIFKDLSTYLSLRPQVKYLGWGESINGVRVVEHVADAPKVSTGTGSFRVKPGHSFRVYKPGTTTAVGRIDHSWGWYQKRGVDSKYPNRWLINSAAYGGVVAFPFADTNGKRYSGEYEEK